MTELSEVRQGTVAAPLKVAVIGGGWLGLYALKWCAAEPTLDVVMFEKDHDIGGNWLFRPNRAGGVWQSTHATASKTYLHASDFPMPEETPYFPHHSDVMKFLHAYCDNFDLWKRIRLNTNVESVRRVAKGWEVRSFEVDLTKSTEPYWEHTKNDAGKPVKVEIFDRVVIATGQNIPTTPRNEAPFKNFTGEHIDADEYKSPDKFRGKRVMVVGGGESATDIAYELSTVADKTYLSMRSGVWMHDRLMGKTPADVLVNRAVYVPGRYQSGLISAAQFLLEVVWGDGGSGVAEWQPKGIYFRSFLNKSRDALQAVARGDLIPRDEVTRCEGSRVWTAMHGPDELDCVIYATGMRENVHVLEPRFAKPLDSLYDYVWNVDDPTLAFCGTVRPIFGSFMTMAELQGRYIAAVWSGRVRLPNRAGREAGVRKMLKWHQDCFTNDHKRLRTLVNHWHYCDLVAERIGAKPHLWYEHFFHWRRWWLLVSGPWSPFQYLVNDPKHREQAFKNILMDWPYGNNGFQICYLFAASHLMALYAAGAVVLGCGGMFATRAYRGQDLLPATLITGAVQLFGSAKKLLRLE